MEHHPFFWIIDDEWPDYSVETALLRQTYPHCRIECSGIPFDADLQRFGAEADVLLAQISAEINVGAILRLSACQGIAVFGGGYDNVDVSAAKAQGITVTNVNGYCAEDIADYVLAVVFHSGQSNPSDHGEGAYRQCNGKTCRRTWNESAG